MRLTTGTGIVMIAVGAVLAFAIHPPKWLAPYLDLIDLGLVLVWVGALILAVNVYLFMPRRPRPVRQAPPPGPPDSERYAPGRFASPRYSEASAPDSRYAGSPSAGYPAAGYPADPTRAYPEPGGYPAGGYPQQGGSQSSGYDDQQTYPSVRGPYADPGATPPVNPPAQDPPTQQIPRDGR